MQKKWLKFVTVGAAVLVAAVVLVGPVAVLADDYGLKATAGAAKIPTDKNVQTIIGNVIGTALSMISVLFFALMLYAGIKWMLARGDSDEAKKALDTIIAAIIGMLVVLGSYAITNFVFGTLGQGGGVSSSPTTPGGPSSPALPGTGSCVVIQDVVENCSTYTSETQCVADDVAGCVWSGTACSTKGLTECGSKSASACADLSYCEFK